MGSHSRNPAEMATILALAYRAGIAGQQNGTSFSILPATEGYDRYGKFDLIIIKTRGNFTRELRVDVTTSYRYKGFKIARAVKRAKQGKKWPYILKVDWKQAAFIPLDPCFNQAWDQIQDGVPATLAEVCPQHGNNCALAQKLFSYSQELNAILESETTGARYFTMPLQTPRFN